MEKNNKIVIMSLVIALIALLIIILCLSFVILMQKARKARVENLIDPLASLGDDGIYGGSIVNIYDGSRGGGDDDDDDDDPINGNPRITNIPDISFLEDTVFNTLDLDNYVTDSNHTLAELVWNVSGNTNIIISIDNASHVVTFSAPLNWNGVENVTFRVTDPDGLYDEENVTVTVIPVDDSLVWSSLSSQTIDEDSNDGTVVYSNIMSRVSDPDSPITLTVGPNSHFNVLVNGNDLVIDNLEANWYGSEIVTVYANGVPAGFTLNIKHLLDDCVEICSWGTCYELCD